MHTVTRKPRNNAEVAQRFASGLGRPDTDMSGNTSISEHSIPHYRVDNDYAESYRTTYVSYSTPIAWMSTDGLRVWATPESYSISTSQHQSHLRNALLAAGFKETGSAIWMPSMSSSRYYWRRDRNIEFTEWKRTARARDKAMADEANRKPASQGPTYTYELPAMIPADPSKRWYKVTDANGQAYSGGNWQYDLPKDGNPGEWTPSIEPVWCSRAWHVTDKPSIWMRGDDCLVHEVNVQGDGITAAGQDKSVWPSIQLVREISHDEARKIGK